MTAIVEPVTADGKHVRANVSDEVWLRRVTEAKARAAVFERIRDPSQSGSLRSKVRELAPTWSWSRFVHMERRVASSDGPVWERLLDRRLPPSQRLDDDVRIFAEWMRRVDRSVGHSLPHDR